MFRFFLGVHNTRPHPEVPRMKSGAYRAAPLLSQSPLRHSDRSGPQDRVVEESRRRIPELVSWIEPRSLHSLTVGRDDGPRVRKCRELSCFVIRSSLPPRTRSGAQGRPERPWPVALAPGSLLRSVRGGNAWGFGARACPFLSEPPAQPRAPASASRHRRGGFETSLSTVRTGTQECADRTRNAYFHGVFGIIRYPRSS